MSKENVISVRFADEHYAQLARSTNGGSPGSYARQPLGKWLGQGAKALGLSGDVDPQVCRNLMAGFSPDGETVDFKNSGDKGRPPSRTSRQNRRITALNQPKE